jgi:guanine deaminase
MSADHDKYMDIALEEGRKGAAEGNPPVGSVIVRDGEIIGVGRNRVNSDTDPTAHAEVDAIRDACRNIGSTDLSGAVCYTSMEPCPMCCWAIEAAGCSGVVLGSRHTDFRGASARDYGQYSVETLMKLTGRSLDIVTDVKIDECNTVRRDWNTAGNR